MMLTNRLYWKQFVVLTIITNIIILLQLNTNSYALFVPKGRKCRLQEMHCDIMHPEKQCCPGTSCGVRRINNNLVNICMMCLDIGESCGNERSTCCRGLKCQKITALSSACIPAADFKFYPDYESITIESKNKFNDNSNDNGPDVIDHDNREPIDPRKISLASLLML